MDYGFAHPYSNPGYHYYSHFKDEETEARELSNLSKDQLVSGRDDLSQGSHGEKTYSAT